MTKLENSIPKDVLARKEKELRNTIFKFRDMIDNMHDEWQKTWNLLHKDDGENWLDGELDLASYDFKMMPRWIRSLYNK